MTRRAARCSMRPDQWKTGIGVVIEGRRFPAGSRMAARTIRSARALVDVVFRVAGDALGRRSCPALSCMACDTGYASVRPGQGKTGRSVVEWQCLLPGRDSVTVLTVLSQSSEMRILPGMAGRAGCRYAAIVSAVSVTSCARRFRMATEQGVVGQLVIEACPGEAHERKIAAMMIAVACLARLRFRIRFAVESQSAANIGVDALVAGQAFSVLRLSRKGFMAGRAIGLQLRVCCAQGARRNEPFHDALRKGQMRSERQPCNGNEAQATQHQYMCTAMMWMIAVTTRIRKSGR